MLEMWDESVAETKILKLILIFVIINSCNVIIRNSE